ncbi:MAG: D-tyrosyl-tRNA(Tyr) deacylase [Bacteroidetes bacterium]|nr:D-tyrosyl-tRNA(Tyr) deacylase [Bacteroidota bacterium]
MRVVIQRVSQASLTANGEDRGSIQKGLVILLGVEEADTQADADWLVNKIVNMRIFSDEEGKMNQSLLDIEGSLMIVSQFTLHASTKKGNRPSFIKAARPEQAIPLYEHFIQSCTTLTSTSILTGVFGADMQITLTNDGPVTITIDSKERE